MACMDSQPVLFSCFPSRFHIINFTILILQFKIYSLTFIVSALYHDFPYQISFERGWFIFLREQ
ncbi:hypothetical protein RUMOBE_02432 [Blautia obeum ATCC 29174]|uniref:Uncharacterized protein n=1 Tax=Blautia obeum ATCC 29174 TaxID=411459 RepID=A5ZTV2_9FIRM|nr:hypothetical protein RUMOBE_02432 [Blautia obeum ATCC 29174]